MRKAPDEWAAITTNSAAVNGCPARSLVVDWIAYEAKKVKIGIHYSANGWDFGNAVVTTARFPADAEYLHADKTGLVPPGRLVELS